MTIVETVRIQSEVSDDNPLGYVIINKEDFDSTQHKLFDESPKSKSAPAPAQTQPWLAK